VESPYQAVIGDRPFGSQVRFRLGGKRVQLDEPPEELISDDRGGEVAGHASVNALRLATQVVVDGDHLALFRHRCHLHRLLNDNGNLLDHRTWRWHACRQQD